LSFYIGHITTIFFMKWLYAHVDFFDILKYI
jgi:hypothetical protein